MMERALEFLTNFHWLLLPQVLAESLCHADWKGSYLRDGILGLCLEACRSVLGINSYPFFVPLDCGWSGRQIEQLLAGKGIKLWGWAFANGMLFFHVKRSQAEWAQYLMLHEGIPLVGPLLGKTPLASRHVPGVRERPSQPPRSATDTAMTQAQQQLHDMVESILAVLNF
jgi:hypothetical protein